MEVNTSSYGNMSRVAIDNTSVAGGDNAGSGDTVSHAVLADGVIHQIVLPTICACGILGILLTVIVLSRKNMCTSTNCYLMALAIADLLFLVLFATRLAQDRFVPRSREYYIFTIYASYAVIFLHIFLMASVWLTVMLAVERYIAICRPFLAAKVCSVVRARIFIMVIFLFAFACRLPNFWEYRVVTYENSATNTSLTYIDNTDFSYNPHYMRIYPWLVDGVLCSMLPFILLLLLNARLIWEVRKSTQYIQRNLIVAGTASNIQREELQITIMLISVIIVFFICQAPYVIYTAMASINEYSSGSEAFILFQSVTKLLLTLKSAVNFIIYCWFSEKFWATLKRIFCLRRCTSKRKQSQSQNGSYYNLRRYSNCTRDTTI